jgi:hypothetical protein
MLSSSSRLIEAKNLTGVLQKAPGSRLSDARHTSDRRRYTHRAFYREVLPRVAVTVTRAHEDVTTTLIVGVQRPQVA